MKPAVEDDDAKPPEPPLAEEAYPVFSMPPESPSWIIGSEEPFVETPESITVTRFTHEGILVKSIAVPDVEACVVFCVNTDCTAPVNVFTEVTPPFPAVVAEAADPALEA